MLTWVAARGLEPTHLALLSARYLWTLRKCRLCLG